MSNPLEHESLRRTKKKRTVDTSKTDLRYLEQWDLTTLMTENVDIPNSQASLNIPLVDHPISKSLQIAISAVYNSGDVSTNGLLGNGWSLQLPDDYIIVDQNESVFPDNFEYYLIINSQMEKLTRKASGNSNSQSFQLEDDENIDITYDPSNERWIIDTKNLRAVYGRAENSSSEAIQRTLFWNSWRGPGRGDKDKLEPQAQAWHIISREEKHSQKRKLLYEYHIEEERLSNGMSYTATIQLKSIRDENNTTRLDLKYGTKNREEYVVRSPETPENFLQFPVFLQSKLYLEGYHLSTEKFQQEIQFHYEIKEGKVRNLVGVTQLYPQLKVSEELFKFEYENEHHLLQKLERGSNSSGTTQTVSYAYSQLQIPLLNFGVDKNTARFYTTEHTQVSISSDYAAMAYRINDEKVYLTVLNEQLTSPIAQMVVSDDGANKVVENFILLTFENLVAVFVETASSRYLSTFHRDVETQEWSQTQEKSVFEKGDLFRYSDNIMAISKNSTGQGQITIFEPDKNNKENGLQKNVISLSPGGSLKRFLVQGQIILAYDGNFLFTLAKNGDKIWQKNSNLLQVSSDEETFVKDLYMDGDFAKYFTDQVKVPGLQMIKNMVLLSVVKWQQEYFSCKVHLLLLNENYEVAMKQEFFPGDDKVEKHIGGIIKEINQNGYIHKFRYEKVNGGRWQAKAFQLTGKYDDDLQEECDSRPNGCSAEEIADAKKRQLEQFNLESESDLKKMVLFDPSPCLEFQLDSKGSKTNSTLIHMQGASWLQVDKEKDENEKDPISNMALAKDFILESKQGKNDTSFQLFKQNLENGGKLGEILEEFTISENGTMAIGYPSYLAYQEEPYLEPIIIPLKPGGVTGEKISLMKGEKLLTSSNEEIILTLLPLNDDSLRPYTHELLSRRVTTLVASVPTTVIQKSEVRDGEGIRLRTYENSFVSNRETLSQENSVRVIPTGNASYSGWYEETTILPVDEPFKAKKEEKWVDSEGKVVRSKVNEFKDDDEEENVDETNKLDYKIMDVSGDLQISDIFPYNKTHQMVSYFGFESYENKLNWTFPDNGVTQDGGSLTGESFLRLEKGEKLSTFFTPSDQLSTYVASCWIRSSSNEQYQFEAPVPYFKASLETTIGSHRFLGLYGQMKRERDNWLYLEVTADFNKIRNVVYSEYYQVNQKLSNNSLPAPNTVKFGISIEIDGGKHPDGKVDIDHIRFMPIQSNLRMKVYDEKNGNEMATILPNGAVIRKVYNSLGQEVANVDENGEIEQLTSSSYTGTIFPTPIFGPGKVSASLTGMKSDLIIRPEWALYEKIEFLSGKWATDDETGWELCNWEIFHVHPDKTNELRAANVEKLFDPSSSSIRLDFKLDVETNSKIQFTFGNEEFVVELKRDSVKPLTSIISISSLNVASNLPMSGELILFLENSTIWMWLNGNLIVEQKLGVSLAASTPPLSSFSMKVGGLVSISNIMILNRPQIFQEFFNGFGDRTQVIQLEGEDSILISENIYDEIGREAIKTKTARIQRDTLGRSISLPLFTYLPNFTTNKNPEGERSVFKTGILEGLVSDLYPQDEGFPYTRKIFLKDLLRESEIDGLPGKDFSASSTFTKRHYRESGLPFMRNLFPLRLGFVEKVVREPNGALKVSIIDKREQEIANYVRVPGFEDLLTTFEYDEQGNLLKILPPTYHEKVNTFSRTTPLPIGDEGLSQEEKVWQAKLCTHFKYNERNYLIQKRSPDTGAHEYKYDIQGNMRFMYSLIYDEEKQVSLAKNIIYLTHATKNQLVEVGNLPTEMKVEDLLKFENSTTIPNQIVHQRIVHSDSHSDPEIRGKVKLFMTYTTEQQLGLASAQNIPPPHQELLKYNAENHVVLKTSNAVHSNLLTNLHTHYKRGKVSELQYPRNSVKGFKESNSLSLIHSHDKAGNLVGLGTRGSPSLFSKFSYSSGGTILEEIVEPGTNSEFIRKYTYDSPGHLVQISDPFLTQNLAFTRDGYGQNGFGDGIIMNTGFEASWGQEEIESPEKFIKWFGIDEEAFADGDKFKTMCLTALKRLGFIDPSNSVPLRFLTYKDTSLLPMACGGSMGHLLMKIIAEKLPPSKTYGHRYAYGTHQELTKSKFYSGNSEEENQGIDPLQVHTFFKEITEVVDEQNSEEIWDVLTQAGYIITDNKRPEDKAAAIGKEGLEPIFAFNKLDADLNEIDPYFFAYTRQILYLIFEIIEKNEEMIDLATFQETFVVWLGYRDMSTPTLIINRAKADAKNIYEMLEAKGYLSGEIGSILDPKFLQTMASFSNLNSNTLLISIVSVLRSHFSTQIGSTVNDYEAFSIDSNGNQKMFYVGLDRYTLNYSNDSNQVSQLKIEDPFGVPGENIKIFELDHDSLGNVNKAPHRNIREVRYHPVTNRPVYMELEDGRTIIFQYDAQGERILKRVYNSQEVLLSEVKYLRDEKGKVLMDERTKFAQSPEETTSTTITSTYIHGPRGLLGFIRNGKFYNVFTDHAGSIRLVTQGGKVVAGYDYWPYGELMRVFGDEDGHIHYRFTGQEWDEETGLYNYHARIYDPILGRFFQPDPKSQYYSPYVYAGNSPISLVDPDGEFFLALIFGLVGAFLGAAKANGTFNPFKWDWKNINTYIGLVGGAIAGVALPGAFTALAATLGGGLIGAAGALLAGLGGSYVSMALENKSWNPGKWDWTSPATWNAFFTGFRRGLKIGSNAAKGISKTLSKTGQIATFVRKYAIGTLKKVVTGSLTDVAKGYLKEFNFKEWDLTNPATLAAIKSGFLSGSGSGLPQMSASYMKVLTSFIENGNIKDMVKSLTRSTSELFKNILKDKNHPLYKSVGAGLLNHLSVSIEQGSSFDITKWDWKSLSTYEGVLNGLAEAADLIDLVGEYRDGNLRIEKGKIFEQLTTKKGQVGGFLGQVMKGMDQLSQFYFPRIPVKKESAVPIAIHLLMNLVGPTASVKQEGGEESEDYEAELRILLEGISSGSKIFPDTDLGQYLDCNGTNNCDIGSGTGKTWRQNREKIHKLFEPTQKYQSPNNFFEVVVDGNNSNNNPEEFLDWFIPLIENVSGDQSSAFFKDYFAGATYFSLLNYLRGGQNNLEMGNVFIRSEKIEGVESNLLHIAYFSKSKLSVRIIASGSSSTPANFDVVRDYVKRQKYLCQLPSLIASQIDEIEAQIYLLEVQEGGASPPKLFTMTPILPLEMNGCNDDDIPQLIQITPPTGGSPPILNEFEAFLQEKGSPEIKVQKFEQFATNLVTLFDDMVKTLGEERGLNSLSGFIYGMLSCNFMNTYDLQFQLNEGGSESITIGGRRDGAGKENWHATPIIISPEDAQADDIEKLTHLFSSATLSKEAIIAKLEMNKLISFASLAIPQFQSILNKTEEGVGIGVGSSLEIESYLKYAYYTHLDRVQNYDGEPSQNLHYVSNLILGELLSQTIYNFEKLEIQVFSPATGSEYERRLGAQRLFFLRDGVSGNCTVLNIIESSKDFGKDPVFDPSVPSNIPVIPGDAEISSLRHLKIKLNVNSVLRFGNSSQTFGEHDFFQGIEELEESPSQIPTDSTSYFKIESELGADLRKLSFDKSSVHSIFTALSENRYKPLVNSGLDFQSLTTGFLHGMAKLAMSDVDGMHIELRSRGRDSTSADEQSLLTLSRDNFVVPQGEQVLLQNLKFSKEGEQDVESEFAEASNDLKETFCRATERLSEAWKVTTVPAVYGPEMEQAIRFEVDPPSIKDGNCTVPRSFYDKNWYGNLLQRNGKVEPGFAKSSASKPFNIFKFLSKTTASFSEYIVGSNKKKSSSFKRSGFENDKKWLHDNTEDCQAGAWVDSAYSMDGITCFTEKSKVVVFRAVKNNDMITEKSHQNIMIGDSYDKRSCTPLEFNGMPSVTCEGQKTNLVYTPYLQDRIFDNLDANIMMGRLLIHFGSKLFGKRSAEERFYEKFGVEQVALTDDMIDILERKLGKVEKIISDATKLNNIEFDETLRWAQNQAKDCRETLAEISVRNNHGFVERPVLERLQERIAALCEDVQEQISDILLQNGGKTGEGKTGGESNSGVRFENNFNVNINDFIARNVGGFISSVGNLFVPSMGQSNNFSPK